MQYVPITRHQGETYPVELNMTSAGVALPITGFTFELIVNAKQAPAASDPDLFSSTGSIVDADAGTVHFPITAEDADHIGRYYHRVKMTDAGGNSKVVLWGAYLLLPENQAGESLLWTPPTEPADGTPVPIDGSVHFNVTHTDTYADDPVALTYETRDGRRVIRHSQESKGNYDTLGWFLRGPAFPRQTFPYPGWTFEVVAYLELGLLSLEMQDGVYWQTFYNGFDVRDGDLTGAAVNGAYLYNEAAEVIKTATVDQPLIPIGGPGGWPVAGWYKWALRISPLGVIDYQIHPEETPAPGSGEYPDTWLSIEAGHILQPSQFPILAPNLFTRRAYPEQAAAVVDLYSYSYERYFG